MQGSHSAQNETHSAHLGMRLSAAPRRRACATRLATRGFTLTELLIVIAIIGVLASLITAAAMNALRRAREASISLDIKNISGAIEAFKTEFGAYPPNGMAPMGNTRMASDMERMAKQAFPRIHPAELAVFRALGGDLSGIDQSNSTITVNGMTGSEALYFWLGGFSSDPQFPLSGPGGPSYDVNSTMGEVLEDRNRRYEFELTGLSPRVDGELDYANVRSITYQMTLPGDTQRTRRINLWCYRPGNSERSLVYFDASRYKPVDYMPPSYDPNDPEQVEIYPLLALREGAVAGSTEPADYVFANHRNYQILHTGLDEAWGTTYAAENPPSQPPVALTAPLNWLIYPEGPFIGEIADNLTNLSDGTLEDAQEN